MALLAINTFFIRKAPNTVSIVGTPSHGMTCGTRLRAGLQEGAMLLSCFSDTLCFSGHSRQIGHKAKDFRRLLALPVQGKIALTECIKQDTATAGCIS
jgi:hypothetical protein